METRAAVKNVTRAMARFFKSPVVLMVNVLLTMLAMDDAERLSPMMATTVPVTARISRPIQPAPQRIVAAPARA